MHIQTKQSYTPSNILMYEQLTNLTTTATAGYKNKFSAISILSLQQTIPAQEARSVHSQNLKTHFSKQCSTDLV